MSRHAKLAAVLIGGLAAAGQAPAATVYSNDFQSGSTSGFTLASGVAIQTAPDGTSDFLGYLSTGADAKLALNALPGHSSVTITFTLYGLRTLDGGLKGGNDNCCGPDYFTVNYASSGTPGTTIFNNDFANPDGNGTQDYPSPPDASSPGHPAQTGAPAVGELGIAASSESTYQFSLTVADTSSSLSIDFIGNTSQPWSDEGFGIDNITVSVSGQGPVNAPEPASLALFGAALSGLGLLRFRRR